jgi:hypothetical protein
VIERICMISPSFLELLTLAAMILLVRTSLPLLRSCSVSPIMLEIAMLSFVLQKSPPFVRPSKRYLLCGCAAMLRPAIVCCARAMRGPPKDFFECGTERSCGSSTYVGDVHAYVRHPYEDLVIWQHRSEHFEDPNCTHESIVRIK